MLPFEFVVAGPPLSQQTRDRAQLQAWKEKVRHAAQQLWPAGDMPERGVLHILVTYYHEAATTRMDNDNMVKPIQDALNGLVYADDRQITDTQIRKTSLRNPRFNRRNLSEVLTAGFESGTEFLHIVVKHAPDHTEPLQ